MRLCFYLRSPAKSPKAQTTHSQIPSAPFGPAGQQHPVSLASVIRRSLVFVLSYHLPDRIVFNHNWLSKTRAKAIKALFHLCTVIEEPISGCPAYSRGKVVSTCPRRLKAHSRIIDGGIQALSLSQPLTDFKVEYFNWSRTLIS